MILYHIYGTNCDIIASVNRIIVTIPAYEPDLRLVTLVRRLKDTFDNIIVVDDGSRSADAAFADLELDRDVTILRHAQNLGKGQALKTAFAEILRRFPNAVGTVTVDADGQHLPKDVIRVAESLLAYPKQLTIGVRTFGKNTPARSKLGNLWTLAEFKLLTGRTVHDTQTGLRGIPLTLLPRFAALPGSRYEYEIRMLVNAAIACGPVVEVPIETVYDNGNSSSHFRPLTDTFATQRALFAAAFTERLGW